MKTSRQQVCLLWCFAKSFFFVVVFLLIVQPCIVKTFHDWQLVNASYILPHQLEYVFYWMYPHFLNLSNSDRKGKVKWKSWRILCWGQNKTLYSQHAHNVLTVLPEINDTPVWCIIEMTELTVDSVYHYIRVHSHWFVLVSTSVGFEAMKCLTENWNFTSLLLTLWLANVSSCKHGKFQ